MKKNAYLRPLFSDQVVEIDATDGTETIAKATDVFKGWIDGDFVKCGLNKKEQSTPVVPVTIYELKKDGTFADMFGSLGNIDDICFEQSQVKGFCRKHHCKLRKDGYATLFLIKNGKRVKKDKSNVFVVCVFVGVSGLEVLVHRFSLDEVWPATDRNRFVSLQQ